MRDTHAALTSELHPELKVNAPFEPPGLFLSGRVIFEERIPVAGPDAVFLAGQQVVGFRLNSGRSWKPGCLGRLQLDMERAAVKAKVIVQPWDIIELNAGELEKEAARPGRRRKSEGRSLPRGVTLVGPKERLSLAKTARVWPGVIISTETGPVTVSDDAGLRPGSVVEGPCFVGQGTVIDGAKVRPGCSFGPQCRLGGEVEASVFQGFANKHHDGFIGHSFVSEWVNLGALTSNSDLRNDYGPVKVIRGGRPTDTGLTRVGCFIGDHVKTAIGTLLNTGAVVGSFANWFAPGLSPREIAPFSRGTGARLTLEDALFTMRQVMLRRGRAPGPALLAHVAVLHQRGATAGRGPSA
jgi:UDP-N-acetylglucosamine diphosphorylase/glucosamine-1-phosphate N-acetyltransferase